MTNEEAFKDWLKFISVELTGMDLKIAEAAWQAAIAYMQEQSEPVAEAIRERDRLGFAVVNVIGKLDEIIENTQEVEIDDFLHIAISIDMWNELQAALEDMPKRADLYTSPQPRDWVGLTSNMVNEICQKYLEDSEIVQETEAKLKELNSTCTHLKANSLVMMK